VLVVVHSKHIVRWRRDLVGMSVTADGNDDGTKSGSLVTNDGHQRRNNRHHAGDKLWGFHKNSAYGVSQ
jgi:hypothetical protein